MANNLMPQQKAKAHRTYLNESEVAEWLNLSKRTLQNWRWNGEGACISEVRASGTLRHFRYRSVGSRT